MKLGIKKKTKFINNKYIVDIDITVDEWKQMLLDGSVFDQNCKDMILQWYFQEGYLATSKSMTNIYYPDLKNTPYNGFVIGLTKRIQNHLNNRFWVESFDSEKEAYWSTPFEGWNIDGKESNHFVWKLRDELVAAIDSIPGFADHFIRLNEETIFDYDRIIIQNQNNKEGKRIIKETVVIQRSQVNKKIAKQLNIEKYGRLTCEVCGFDFEKVYGIRGYSFIEVHHNKPLYLTDGEVVIDPKDDLNCLCSNCHRIIHRNKSEVLTVEQLKNIIEENK